MTQWSEDVNRRIARAVRAARGDDVSAQDVADKTKELGHHITRDTIANLESGRKKSVDVAELIVLAKALNVAPISLIYPDLLYGEVEDVPDHIATTEDAILAFVGHPDDESVEFTSMGTFWDYYNFQYAAGQHEEAGNSAAAAEARRAAKGARDHGIRVYNWVVNDE
ncbi:helix-turn-helix domain-containing protein [Mycobacterium conspicuum]|uniref:HTH cro/C1-type domain-containing protein n=1 Tax=Mycobacterium conspicuum TaxID=44010 RepID=A0A7I7Y874_9MYCO|nr:helix-turn-helix transcriptional regulator [Mycobacterium conspicuum]BBZ37101.1 hypothetical protein MCNS_01640 [Mycobacterium conspicuum]